MRKLLGLLVLSLAIMLCGCTSDIEEPTVTDPTHIYEEVREDFLIDAEVSGFTGDGTVTIYEATPRLLTEDQINDFLAANSDSITEWTNTYNPERITGYTGITALDGKFRHGVYTVGLYPSSLSYYNARNERWGNCHIYGGQQHYDDNAHYVFAHLFVEPIDFDFATAQEAESEVRELLSILSLDDLILNRTLYIDHKILANEVTPILQTEEWQSEDKSGFIPTYDDWSEADDGYIFEFFVGVDGCPMLYQSILTDTLPYQGASVEVWYQASGIVALYVQGSPWIIGDSVDTMAHCIPATEALTTARVRLENTRSYTNTVVDKISGQYMYVIDGDRFLLRPVWVVYAKSASIFYPEKSFTKYVVIDAITGDELM